MRKFGTKGIALLSGTMILAAASLALACTTKTATVVGRVSMAAAPAGSACAASGEACCYFEVMSATNADGLALGDLTGKTMKAAYSKDAAVPASWTKDAIYVATADVDWDRGVLRLSKVESANEAVAAAAIATWQKSGAVMAAASTMPASGKSGCCASKTDAAAAAASSKSCAAKADAATASSGKSCSAKADAATASTKAKGSCESKSAAAAAAARALTFNVSGMTCKGCVSKVEAALLAVKGVSGATVDLEKHNATVGVSDDVKADDLVKAIESAGFKAEIASATTEGSEWGNGGQAKG